MQRFAGEGGGCQKWQSTADVISERSPTFPHMYALIMIYPRINNTHTILDPPNPLPVCHSINMTLILI